MLILSNEAIYFRLSLRREIPSAFMPGPNQALQSNLPAV
jgi:hypothetical protein